MKTCSTLLFASLAAQLFACANPPENAHSHKSEASEEINYAEIEPDREATNPADTPEIKLNNGQPWEANAETTKGIVLMADLAFRFTERDDRQAYANLQKELKQEFGHIIEKCTMKGEAHNQLHHYLVPLQGYIEGLTSEDLTEAVLNLDQLKIHLSAYSTYFVTR